jgi:hypothetical protein
LIAAVVTSRFALTAASALQTALKSTLTSAFAAPLAEPSPFAP